MWEEISKSRSKPYTSEYALKQWFFARKDKPWPLYSVTVYRANFPKDTSDINISFAVKADDEAWWDSHFTGTGIPLELMQLMLTRLWAWLSAQPRPPQTS